MTAGTWRYPGVVRLVSGGAVAETADWMLLVALPLFVLGVTGSPLITSIVFVLQAVLSVAAAPLAGLLIDHADPWHLMGGTAAAQAVAVLPLIFVDTVDDLWIVYLVAIVQSVLGAIIEPARPSVAAALVPPAHVAPVNQLLGVGSGLARLVGAPIGGLVLGLGGVDALVVATVAAYAVACAALFTRAPKRRDAATPPPADLAIPHTMERDAAGAPPRTTFFAELGSGLAIVAADRVLRRLMMVAMLMSLAQGLFTILFVLFVQRSLGGGDTEVGILRGIQAVGALIAGLGLMGVVGRVAPWRLAAASILGFGVLTLAIWNLPALTTWFPVYVVLFALVGAPGLVAMTAMLTIVDRETPASHRGRVTSLLFAALTALQAVGTLLGGFVGSGPAFTASLQVQGALYLAAGLLALTMVRRGSR
ncbi:MFS family permease [Microbacterium proteolyticum]|uniref:MFS family permease n=1 Tax=Microbacterium proteolyticum TaxID=1572644 RepID=A0A7W5CEX6_9MICO|nr:MFS transporter [Microbacterium proteolyticum]MBB3156441.1 MFS family permease [Microbacterium proteolyticum]